MKLLVVVVVFTGCLYHTWWRRWRRPQHLAYCGWVIIFLLSRSFPGRTDILDKISGWVITGGGSSNVWVEGAEVEGLESWTCALRRFTNLSLVITTTKYLSASLNHRRGSRKRLNSFLFFLLNFCSSCERTLRWYFTFSGRHQVMTNVASNYLRNIGRNDNTLFPRWSWLLTTSPVTASLILCNCPESTRHFSLIVG